MVKFTSGNMFDTQWKILVNTVNTQGIMGKGVALETKKRFPEIMSSYKNACRRGMRGGDIHIYPTGNQYIVNFATKEDWRNPSTYEWIQKGLYNLKNWLDKLSEAQKVVLPPLGCGNGGLDFKKVKKMIEKTFKNSKHEIVVYEPN